MRQGKSKQNSGGLVLGDDDMDGVVRREA